MLEQRGCNFEYNYSPGRQQLSTVLLSLLILAFLFHIVLPLSCPKHQAIRQKPGPRRTFFNDLRALTRYLYFDGWEELLNFMCRELELAPG